MGKQAFYRLIRMVLLAALLTPQVARAALPVLNVFRTGRLDTGEPSAQGQFTITKDQSVAINVHFAFTGIATREVDYTVGFPKNSPTNLVYLDAPSASALLTIFVNDDHRPETNETITLTILPDPSYTLGPLASATMTLRDDDPYNPTNTLPTVAMGTLPQFATANTPLSLKAFASDYDGDIVAVEFFDGTNSIQTLTQPIYTGSTQYSFNVTNLGTGDHEFYARATDDRGGIAESKHQSVLVGTILAPEATGSITPDPYVSGNFQFFVDSYGRSSPAIVEYSIPAGAGDRQGDFFFTVSHTIDPFPSRVEVLLFEGNGSIQTNDLNKSLSYVTSFLVTNINQSFRADLSPWLAQFAGKHMGIMIRLDPAQQLAGPRSSSDYQCSGQTVILLSTKASPPAPRIQFANIPPEGVLPSGGAVSIDVALSGLRGNEAHWAFFGDTNLLASGEISADPSGTNRYSVTWTNPPLREHVASFVLTDINGVSVAAETRSIYIYSTAPPEHRFFTATGLSTSYGIIDAAGRAEVWGANSAGQLGIGTNLTFLPQPVTVPPPPGLKWRQASMQGSFTLWLADDGSLWFSGYQPNTTNRAALSPVKLNGTNPFPRIQQIATTLSIGYVVDALNRLWTFDRSTFATASDFYLSGPRNWTRISAARNNLTGIADGKIVGDAWGIFAPPAGDSWSDISAAYDHVLALTASGKMYAWGSNNNGQLPMALSGTNEPALVSIPGIVAWTKIAAGTFANLAVDDHGKLYSWGSRATGAREPILHTPTLVDVPSDVTGWLDITVTDTLAMALANDGRVFTWGPFAPNSPFPKTLSGLPIVIDPFDTRNAIAFFGLDAPSVYIQATMKIAAPAGTVYALETSSDLVHWTRSRLLTNDLPLQTILIPNTPDASIFYRLGAP